MAKKTVGFIKLQIAGGKANPSPPIGPALGQKGINIMEFCKTFNARTQKDTGVMLPTIITVYSDRSFTFVTKTPPASYLLKQKLKLKSGANKPGHEVVGKVKKEVVEEIAKIKEEDLTAADLAAACRIIEGSKVIDSHTIRFEAPENMPEVTYLLNLFIPVFKNRRQARIRYCWVQALINCKRSKFRKSCSPQSEFLWRKTRFATNHFQSDQR